MSEIFPEIDGLLYESFSRWLLFLVLSVFAITNMMYLGQQHEMGNISESDIETLNMAFEVIGLALLVYVIMPILKYGYKQRGSIGGKVMLGTGIVVHAAGVITLFLG